MTYLYIIKKYFWGTRKDYVPRLLILFAASGLAAIILTGSF